MKNRKTWLGTTEAGRLLDVQPKTLVDWSEKGLMPNVRTRTLPTGRIQFNREDIEQYASVLNGEESSHVQ